MSTPIPDSVRKSMSELGKKSWLSRVKSANSTPIETMMGKAGDPIKCNKFVHWFATNAKKGSTCLCGQTTKTK